jgi:D-alanyl-D-alanine carboxypeptidase (penicillin-binding protein 5/6)
MQPAAVVNKDQPVGRYAAPWGSRTDIVATNGLAVVEWPGMPLRMRLEVPAAQAPLPPGSSAGSLLVTIGDQQSRIPLITADPLFQPGNRWRFLRTDPFL